MNNLNKIFKDWDEDSDGLLNKTDEGIYHIS